MPTPVTQTSSYVPYAVPGALIGELMGFTFYAHLRFRTSQASRPERPRTLAGTPAMLMIGAAVADWNVGHVPPVSPKIQKTLH